MAKDVTMRFLPLMDYEDIYNKSIEPNIIPCGVEGLTNKKQIKEYFDMLFLNSEDFEGVSATCSCGYLTESYYISQTCHKCRTEVKRSSANDSLTYKNWLEIPDFLPPILAPRVATILSSWIGKYEGEPLLFLLMTPGATLPPGIKSWYEPGLVSFHDNYTKLMTYFAEEYGPTRAYKTKRNGEVVLNNEDTPDVIKMNDVYVKCLFTRLLPVLDSNMHIVTTQGTMSFVDQTSPLIMKAIGELINVNYTYSNGRHFDKTQEYTVDFLKAYCEYSDAILHTKLKKKKMFIRQNMLGARCHFAFRGVITPLIDGSPLDELHLPWRIGITQLKLEIINKLINKYNYEPYAAQLHHDAHVDRFDQTIYDIMNELIAECPYKGLVVLFGRNPTLCHGANQLFFITHIKPDLTDDTISIPIPVLKSPNGDFDGKSIAIVKQIEFRETRTGTANDNPERRFANLC